LGAEAAGVGGGDASGGAQGKEGLLDVVCVVAETRPGLAVCVLGQGCVDAADVCGRVGVCDVCAKVPKVRGAVEGRPVELLPGVCRVVHWAANGKGNRHGKVAEAGEVAETKDLFYRLDAFLVVVPDQVVDFVDNVNDAGNTVSRTVLHNGRVPCWVFEDRLDSGTAADSSSKLVVVRLHGKGRLGTSERTTVQDPGDVGSAETSIETGERGMFSKVGVIGNGWRSN